MDDYAEAEVLIPILKKINIPIILFQEGFFVTEKQNNFNLYYFLKYLRRKILPKFLQTKATAIILIIFLFGVIEVFMIT